MLAIFQQLFAAILAFFMGIFGLLPYTTSANTAYASTSSAQKMDIYLPKEAKNSGEPTNAILMIHGGGWIGGDKSNYTAACRDYASRGFVTASINYRMFNNLKGINQDISFNDMLDDIDAAINKLYDVMVSEGITPNKLIILGASAGGHLTLLYAYTRHETCKIPIGFIIDDVGPSDFTDYGYIEMSGQSVLPLISMLVQLNITEQDVLNQIQALAEFSPVYHVSPNVPPTIMRYGGKDELVPLSNGDKLDAALSAAGVPHSYFIYANSGHGLENIADKPGTDYAVNQQYLKTVEAYLELYMK